MPMAIFSSLSKPSISSRCSYFTSTLCFSTKVRAMSREPHSWSCYRSSSRPSLSRWTMSRTWCSAKKAMPKASGRETCPGVLRLGCPMMTSSSSATLSSSSGEVVEAPIYGAGEDALAVGPVVAAAPAAGATPAIEDASRAAVLVWCVAPLAESIDTAVSTVVVMSAFGMASRTGILALCATPATKTWEPLFSIAPCAPDFSR
jgi:hypothetical protein